ncbi:MAG: PEP-CTERM sorting domain-containing protein [Verrucomicrobiaceae bacterium]|nr:PEP-CTERM sorting domain-containing protein [Verrucomicrobiaceae bacterium]
MVHAQTDVSYIGPTGSDNSWTNNANWTGGIAPTSTAFNAIINNGGNVFIPFTSIGLNNLTIGNGSTSGSGLMVDGLITLNNGATVGNNQLATRTGITFGSSVTLSNVHGLSNGDGTLSATATWNTGVLTFNNATATNSFSSVWNAKAGLYDSIGTGNTFSNVGTFHKNSDASPTGGILTIEPAFNQTSTGTLNVNAGELQLLGGGTHHGATNVLGGTTLNLAGTHTFADSPATLSVAADAVLQVSGGTTTIHTPYSHVGTAVVDSGGLLQLRGTATHTGAFQPGSGGTLEFGGNQTLNAGVSFAGSGTTSITGTVTTGTHLTIPTSFTHSGTLNSTHTIDLTGPATWSGGFIHNAGTTNALNSLTITGGRLNFGHTLNVGDGAGAPGSVQANWTSGNLDFRSSFFNVKADAVLTTTHNGTINSGDGTNSIITIEPGASFIKNTGTGVTTIGDIYAFTFHNQGSVSVNTGTLFLRSSGTHTGTWNVPVGATLDFSNGTRTMNAGTDISAAGTVAFSNGTTTFNGGNYAVTGTTAVNGGGAAVFNVPASTNTLNMSNGTLAGTASFTVTGDTTWSGGWMHNTGTTHLLGTTTLSGGTLVLNAGRTVNLGDGLGAPGSVQANWTSGDININDSFLIVKADAVLTTTHNGNISRGSGSTSVVTIEPGASFIKTTGTGTTTIGNGASFTLNNQGTVSVNSGTLLVNTNATITQHSGTTLTGGTWNVSNGASISVASGSNMTTIGSAASVTLNGAGSSFAKVTTALSNNQGSFTIKNDRDLTTAGAYTNSGTTRVEDSTTVMTIGAGGSAAYTQTGGVTALVNGAFIDPSVFNLNGGTLQGTGTIESNVLAGPGSNTIAPGLSPGALTINGDLTLSSGSTLTMELGGLSQGTLYDYLDVNGVLTLAGMLDLDFINDFQNSLPNNEILTLATANSAILGSFSNVASGGYLVTNYPIPLQVWYGAGSPFGAENLVVAIPEPSRALLMLASLCGLGLRRRRKAAGT